MKHMNIISAMLIIGASSQAYAGSEGSSNTLYGLEAGKIFNGGLQNSFFGRSAGYYNKNGSYNTYIGFQSGLGTTNGNHNTFAGAKSGHLTLGDNNTFIGSNSGKNNRIGFSNTFVGAFTGNLNKTGTDNTFIGAQSGLYNKSGSGNTFVGMKAGLDNTTGSRNTFIGAESGALNTIGKNNTFIGTVSGKLNTTGEFNTFVGDSAGGRNVEGYSNTFIGETAGSKNTSGAGNTYIGTGAGGLNREGFRNVFIGNGAGGFEKGSDRLYIHNTQAFNPLIYGEFDNEILTIHGSLGVNTKSPGEIVDIVAEDKAARFQLTSITNTENEAAQFIQRRAHSNAGAPEAVESGDNIGLFSFRGWNGSGYTGSKAVIAVAATEDWDDASNGNQISFRHTPNGSSDMVTALQVRGNADVYIPNGHLYVKGHKMHVPDYVFKEDYKLMPLDELKAYVQKNNHLPGVVSADEVDKAGVINLSGLQMTLLEKVEELTLYTLQQEEALAAKDAEMKSVKAELKSKDAEMKAMQKRLVKVESLLTNLALDTSSPDKAKVSMK